MISLAGTDPLRKKIHPATQAALWALSNGRCYAPGCPSPVVVEIRPGVYRKNAQIAHIRGVRAPRYDPRLSVDACAAFSNLLILCLPHHAEVDDRKTGEQLYPPHKLHKWKTDHEGKNGTALAALGAIDEESLTQLLVDAFTPPIKRLQQIADQLEKTGTLNAQTVLELRQVVDVMASSPGSPDVRTVSMLLEAADLLGGRTFRDTVDRLYGAADLLGGRTLRDTANKLYGAADTLSNLPRGGRGFNWEE